MEKSVKLFFVMYLGLIFLPGAYVLVSTLRTEMPKLLSQTPMRISLPVERNAR